MTLWRFFSLRCFCNPSGVSNCIGLSDHANRSQYDFMSISSPSPIFTASISGLYNFTYTIQFLYPSTSFSCTFACSVSTQPKFMRLLLKPVLFCSHASNSTAWTAIAAGATSPNDAIPAATSSCPMNVAPWCSGIEVTLSNVGHISSISPPSLSSQSTHISDFAAPTRRFNSWRTLLVAVTKPLKYPSESAQGINMPFGQPKFALNCTNNKYP